MKPDHHHSTEQDQEQLPPLQDRLAYAALQLVLAADAGLDTQAERAHFERLRAEFFASLTPVEHQAARR